MLAVLGAAGCTVVPPPPAPLVALPGPGKTPLAFGQDDARCRTAAASVPIVQPAIAPAQPAASAPQPGTPPTGPAVLTPGEAYLRCMASNGDIIQPLAVAHPAYYGYYPAYPVYAGFGDYYPFLYGDFVGVGFFGGYYGGYRSGFGGDHFGYGGGGFHGGGGFGHR